MDDTDLMTIPDEVSEDGRAPRPDERDEVARLNARGRLMALALRRGMHDPQWVQTRAVELEHALLSALEHPENADPRALLEQHLARIEQALLHGGGSTPADAAAAPRWSRWLDGDGGHQGRVIRANALGRVLQLCLRHGIADPALAMRHAAAVADARQRDAGLPGAAPLPRLLEARLAQLERGLARQVAARGGSRSRGDPGRSVGGGSGSASDDALPPPGGRKDRG